MNTQLVMLGNLLRQVEVGHEAIATLPRERSGSRALPSRAVQEVTLEQVSFHYRGREDARVLTDVNLTFGRGRCTALVGRTGAGKSTIGDLLVRLYDPVAGRILVDGVDLRELDLAAWRRRVGYVTQDAFLFNATLRDNIALWHETVSPGDVERAARAAQCEEFVQTLPDGYDTLVGDRGVRLSGGQRQRVAIARALLHHPDVLILDEATSALDHATEQAVQEAMKRLHDNVVMIVIAHRLSTMQSADQIIVLHEGRVVESGTPAGLLQAGGRFWHLYEGQEQLAEASG